MRLGWRVALSLMFTGTFMANTLGAEESAPVCYRQGVYVFRGFVGYWPDAFGMAARMSNRGYSPHVYRSSDTTRLTPELAASGGQARGPIYLIGYSYGASAAVRMARDLMDYGITVDRLALIECYDHPVISPNVKYCVNIYESRPLDHVQPFRGTAARAEDPSSTTLIDINITYAPEWEDVREDNHFNIADDPRIQDFIAQQFPDVMPPVPTPGAPKSNSKSKFIAYRPELFSVLESGSNATLRDPNQINAPDLAGIPRVQEFSSEPFTGQQFTGQQLIGQQYRGRQFPNVTQQTSNVSPAVDPAATLPSAAPATTAAVPLQQTWTPTYRYPNSSYRATRPENRAPRPEPVPAPRINAYSSYRTSVPGQ